MKYRVRLRDDSQGNVISIVEKEIEFDGTKEQLLTHAHIVEVLSTNEEPKVAEESEDKPVTKKKK